MSFSPGLKAVCSFGGEDEDNMNGSDTSSRLAAGLCAPAVWQKAVPVSVEPSKPRTFPLVAQNAAAQLRRSLANSLPTPQTYILAVRISRCLLSLAMCAVKNQLKS